MPEPQKLKDRVQIISEFLESKDSFEEYLRYERCMVGNSNPKEQRKAIRKAKLKGDKSKYRQVYDNNDRFGDDISIIKSIHESRDKMNQYLSILDAELEEGKDFFEFLEDEEYIERVAKWYEKDCSSSDEKYRAMGMANVVSSLIGNKFLNYGTDYDSYLRRLLNMKEGHEWGEHTHAYEYYNKHLGKILKETQQEEKKQQKKLQL